MLFRVLGVFNGYQERSAVRIRRPNADGELSFEVHADPGV